MLEGKDVVDDEAEMKGEQEEAVLFAVPLAHGCCFSESP